MNKNYIFIKFKKMATPCGMQDLSSLARDGTFSPCS